MRLAFETTISMIHTTFYSRFNPKQCNDVIRTAEQNSLGEVA